MCPRVYILSGRLAVCILQRAALPHQPCLGALSARSRLPLLLTKGESIFQRRYSQVSAGNTVAPREQGSEDSAQPQAQGRAAQTVPELEAALKEHGLAIANPEEGQYNGLLCPKCSGGRSKERSLAVKIDPRGFAYKCHRATCGHTGNCIFAESRSAIQYIKPDPDSLTPQLHPDCLNFFRQRKISAATLERNGIKQVQGGGPPTIVFPYTREGELVNLKYRTLAKKFWQVKGAEKVLYAWDDIKGQSEVIIVEGEVDKLSLEEAGVRNVTSVPDGAPSQVREGRLPNWQDDVKFSFVWNSWPVLDQAKRIVLATDSDGPGRALAEELARRLRPERCWLVSWSLPALAGAGSPGQASVPPSNGAPPAVSSTKDANEVLMAGGPQAVRECLARAVPYPVPGLSRISDLANEVIREHATRLLPLNGLRSGWQNLDNLYVVRPGCITVIAGAPNSGKSEFMLDLLHVLATKHELRSGICSLETRCHIRLLKRLLEKRTGRPFSAATGGRPQMSSAEVQAGLAWLDSQFVLIGESAFSGSSIEYILNLTRIAKARHGLKGLLIDGYHALRPCPQSARDISESMDKLRSFAMEHQLHIWLVAHTVQKDDTGYLLQLCDTGFVLSRHNTQQVHCSVLANNRAVSKSGEITFAFDRRRFTPS